MVDFDISTSVKNLIEAIRHQSRMAHSGIVLASAAILDSLLERALKKAMKPLPKNLYVRLFESNFAPLGSFSSKIVMARALGIITTDIYVELEKIRHIRNDFAHSSKILNFESKEMVPKLLALKKRKTTRAKPAELFVDCVSVIVEFLEAYITPMGEPHEKDKGAA